MTTTASLHNRTVPHYLIFFSPKDPARNTICEESKRKQSNSSESKRKSNNRFFFIKHIYSSFSINRYLQIQITSAFSSHKMDYYLKIYELTKTCSFFVHFFSTIVYSLYKINYKSLLPQTRA